MLLRLKLAQNSKKIILTSSKLSNNDWEAFFDPARFLLSLPYGFVRNSLGIRWGLKLWTSQTYANILTQHSSERLWRSLYLHLTIKPFNDTALWYNVARILNRSKMIIRRDWAQLCIINAKASHGFCLMTVCSRPIRVFIGMHRRIRLRPWVSAFFLFQAFADLRHRQGILRKNSTVRKIKVMKVIRIIGIHNRDNEFPNKVVVSVYESCTTW